MYDTPGVNERSFVPYRNWYLSTGHRHLAAASDGSNMSFDQLYLSRHFFIVDSVLPNEYGVDRSESEHKQELRDRLFPLGTALMEQR